MNLRETENCFGCISLKRKECCVLNKQYSRDDYNQLVPKLIEHMRKTGEWGEYFPVSLSYFGYNETIAHDHFPLASEVANALKFRWHERDKREYQPQQYEIPENIDNVPVTISKEPLTCSSCGKNFKMIEPELVFYRKQRIPIPTRCLDCRLGERLSFRNPMHVSKRRCDQCSKPIDSSYPPSRPEKVFCESCYQEAVS